MMERVVGYNKICAKSKREDGSRLIEKNFMCFISLGPACHVASSMGTYGLRSWSGPFDWLVTSDFSWVLHYIENDFSDFLEVSNLQKISENHFKEKTSGFVFLHDEDALFWKDYEKLCSRYHKKIERFLAETKETCCFLRGVSALEEIEFIRENAEKINHVIKKHNPSNEIIFLVSKNIVEKVDDNFPFTYFIMKNTVNPHKRFSMRGWFNEESEFLKFCAERFDTVSLMKNLIFDQIKECKSVEWEETLTKRYNLGIKILETDFKKLKLSENIVIYGAGIVGRQFYQGIKEMCRVICFVDRKYKGDFIDAIPCVGVDEVDFKQYPTVVVTAVDAFEEIENEILMRCQTANIISLDSIL